MKNLIETSEREFVFASTTSREKTISFILFRGDISALVWAYFFLPLERIANKAE